MKSYQAADARLKMREILTAVEQGEHVEIKRYDTPTAVLVSAEWYGVVMTTAAERAGEDQLSGDEWRVFGGVLPWPADWAELGLTRAEVRQRRADRAATPLSPDQPEQEER